MPAPIIKGVINFLVGDLNCTVWDGEVPRYNTDPLPQLPINPENIAPTPTIWPVVKASMPESGYDRSWTTEDPYSDLGEILVQVWGTRRDQAEPLSDLIEASLAQAANWAVISSYLGAPPNVSPFENPYYVIHMLLIHWCSVQEEGVRTGLSELLYRCDLHYEVMIHGAIPTL